MRKKDILEVKKWKKPNGNVCFSLPMHGLYDRFWVIMTAALISIVVCILIHFIFENLALLAFIAFLTFVFSLWLIGGIVGSNETIIAKTVLQIMDNAVEEDVKAIGANVVKILVNHDTKGTYGIVETSCLLVLLDNGTVWEYPLVYHKTENEGAYFECERDYIISENQQHICKIKSKRWNHFIYSFKLSEKTRLGLLLAAILIIGCIALLCFIYVLVHFKLQYLLMLLGYVGIYCMLEWYNRRVTIRVLNIVKNVISIPFLVFYWLFNSAMPFVTVIGTYLFVALFAFVLPAVILIGFTGLGWLALKLETIIFIVFTLGAIVCSHSYGITKKIIRSTPLRDWGNHAYESYREQLAIYLIHPSNVMFLLYLLYFVFLVISGYLQIEKDRYLITQGIDAAILKAFLVFIAFTNMRVKAKDAELDVRELYQRTLKLFVHEV